MERSLPEAGRNVKMPAYGGQVEARLDDPVAGQVWARSDADTLLPYFAEATKGKPEADVAQDAFPLSK